MEEGDVMADVEIIKSRVRNEAFKLGEGFGRKGNAVRWVIDNRELLLEPEFLALVGRVMWEKVKSYNPTVIAGLEMAGIPLAMGITQAAHNDGFNNVRTIAVRKECKEYGRRRQVDGIIPQSGDRIVVVDDILSSGKTLLNAVDTLSNFPGEVVCIAVIINFNRRGDDVVKMASFGFEEVCNLIEMGMKKVDVVNTVTIPAKWRVRTGNTGRQMLEGGPGVFNQVIYDPNDGCNLKTLSMAGDILSSFDVPVDRYLKGCRTVPMFYNNKVYFSSYGGGLHVLNIATNELITPSIEGLERSHSTPILGNGRLYFTYETNGGTGGGIYCLNPDTFEILWQVPNADYVPCTPTYIPETDSVVFGSNDSRVYHLKGASGEVIWEKFLGAEVKATISYSPTEGCIYVGTFTGHIHCMNINSGEIIWSRKLGKIIFVDPLINDSTLLGGCDSHKVFCLDRFTGKIKWLAALGGRSMGRGAVHNGIYFIGCEDGCVYGIKADNGEIVWCDNIGINTNCQIVVSDNCLFVTDWSGTLHCYDLMEVK